MLFLVCLLYSLVSATYLAPVDSKEGWLRDVSVSRRVKRAKVEFPLSRFSVITWHNYFRRKPAASNMEYLHHSDVLADSALWWARKCLFQYAPQQQPAVGGDLLRTTSSPQITNYGQNIYHISAVIDEDDLLQMALGAWYEESRVYLPKNDTCLIDSCRLYKQLMWARVQAVGCAAVRCDRLRGPNLSNELFLVCNYDIKQTDGQAYQAGYPCSNCSKQQPAAKCDEGLCRRDGKGEVILPGENLVLDPIEGRPTTQKVRLPTLPPGVKEGSLETSPQNKSKESNSDVILRSPSLGRSTASTLVTRSTADRSTQSPSTVSSSLSVSGRSLPTSNSAIPRSTSPTPISGGRSMIRTEPGRTPSTESAPQSPKSWRTTAASGQRTEAVTRSSPATRAAGRSTIGLMLADVGAELSNQLRDAGRSYGDVIRRSSAPAPPSSIADDNKAVTPSSSLVYNPPSSQHSRAPGWSRLATRFPRFTVNQVQEVASRQ